MGRIQKRKTNFSKSSLSACNARPVHTDGPEGDIAPPTSHTEIKYKRRVLRACLDARSITDHNRPFGDRR